MIHTTKDGKQLFITEMTDSHLLNFIKYLFKRYRKIDENTNDISYYATGFRKEELTIEDFNTIVESYSLYFMECMRRNMSQNVNAILADYNPLYKNNEKYSSNINLLDVESFSTHEIDFEDSLKSDMEW